MAGLMSSRDREYPRGQRRNEIRKEELWASSGGERQVKRKHVKGPHVAPSPSLLVRLE